MARVKQEAVLNVGKNSHKTSEALAAPAWRSQMAGISQGDRRAHQVGCAFFSWLQALWAHLTPGVTSRAGVEEPIVHSCPSFLARVNWHSWGPP